MASNKKEISDDLKDSLVVWHNINVMERLVDGLTSDRSGNVKELKKSLIEMGIDPEDVLKRGMKLFNDFKEKHPSKREAHRQICSICNNVCAVDFKVSDKIWELATHYSQRNALICLDCFTKMADIRFVEWDKDIKFYPTSLVCFMKLT